VDRTFVSSEKHIARNVLHKTHTSIEIDSRLFEIRRLLLRV